MRRAAPSLRVRASSEEVSSERSGATDSAAAVGVEQRRALTMSQTVVSGSWPMPVTTGTELAATARTRASSLNGMRSS